jgi:soluble lytic murein transglycosylase
MAYMVNKSYTNIGLLLVMVAAVTLWPREHTTLPALMQSVRPAFMLLTNQTDSIVPAILSERDKALYSEVFQAQKAKDWAKADETASRVHNTFLMGHVLAERYLSQGYQPTIKELTEWLDHYSDHPQAYSIYTLAAAKSPALASKLPTVRKRSVLSGYGTDSGASLRFTAEKTPAWQQGLDAWRAGNKAAAAKAFVSVANTKSLTAWQDSAASYWAWRALDATGQKSQAKTYLERAAEKGRSFYSILARRQLGMNTVETAAIELNESDVLSMLFEPPVRRAIALSQAGANIRAEQELRFAFPQADEAGKLRLLALAHHLNMASVQITMARQLEKTDRALEHALYPVPHWEPQDGFKIDPALIYALARQESGFQPTAISPAGAAGMMQLMPTTASMMKKNLGLSTDHHVTDPAFNLTLGQNYVRHLLTHSMVDGNLIYMLTAYNAGPARLLDWKKTISQNDPLLFIESIPFGETRAYVMQVMTNYWIYSELAGSPSPTVTSMANGYWPNYEVTVASKTIADRNG